MLDNLPDGIVHISEPLAVVMARVFLCALDDPAERRRLAGELGLAGGGALVQSTLFERRDAPQGSICGAPLMKSLVRALAGTKDTTDHGTR